MSDVETYLVLVAAGLAAGGLAGLLGVGGGILMVPFLTLAMSLSQQEAQAISLLVILPTSIVATVTLRRRGVGDMAGGLKLGAIGAVGALAGALVALHVDERALRIAFALLLAFVGVRLVLQAVRTPRRG